MARQVHQRQRPPALGLPSLDSIPAAIRPVFESLYSALHLLARNITGESSELKNPQAVLGGARVPSPPVATYSVITWAALTSNGELEFHGRDIIFQEGKLPIMTTESKRFGIYMPEILALSDAFSTTTTETGGGGGETTITGATIFTGWPTT